MSEWIWGRHPVLEALRAGSAERVLIAHGRQHAAVLDEIHSAAQSAGVPIEETDSARLQKLLPGENTQGVAARISEKSLLSVHELIDAVAGETSPPLVLILDQIQDPHNLGALLRTADAAGVHGVVLTGRRSAPLGGTVAKTSAGAVHRLRVAEATNLVRAMDELRHAGIWLSGLDGEASTTLYEVDLTAPCGIVVGNEGSGLRRLTREHCDFVVRIPMIGKVESLNASVAGSLALYEAVRQRLMARAAAAAPDRASD